MWRIILLLISVLTLHSSPVLAQRQEYAFRQFNSLHGLSQDMVHAIVRDRDGFMWFGTSDGLNRFDGRRCRIFRHNPLDSCSLPDNSVCGLSIDYSGNLWITTRLGISRWDAIHQRFIRMTPCVDQKLPPSRQFFSQVAFTPEGSAWVVADSFLVRWHMGSLHADRYCLPNIKVFWQTDIKIDRKGRVWVIADRNLYQYNPTCGTLAYIAGRFHPDPAQRYSPLFVNEHPNGEIWCSTWFEAFLKYNEQTARLERLPVPPRRAANFIFEERPGKQPLVWADAGPHSGLWSLDLEDYSARDFSINPADIYAHNGMRAYSLFKDTITGILWIGTQYGGVEYYDPGQLKFNRHFMPLEFRRDGSDGTVTGFVQDMADPNIYYMGLWMEGLVVWNKAKNTFRLYGDKEGLPHTDIFDVTRDAKGVVWMATTTGLCWFDPKSGRFGNVAFRPKNKKFLHKGLGVMVARDGRIWCGMNNAGLYVYNPANGRSEHIQLTDGQSPPYAHYVWSLTEDPYGRILASTTTDGFYRYNPQNGRCERLLTGHKEPVRATAFLFDAHNHLWVATYGGIVVLNARDSIVKRITTLDGLHTNMVDKLAFDAHGKLWIGTVNGLQRYDPVSGRLEYFSKQDGLFANEISNSMYIALDGTWMAGLKYAFNTASVNHIPANLSLPKIRVEKVMVNDSARALTGLAEPIVLRPGDNVLTIDFSVIQFTHPEKSVLLWKLEGFDEKWSEKPEPSVTYTNLNGGEYTLLARARNGEGLLSEEILRIPIQVIPPFHKTWAFALLMLVAFGAIAGSIAYYRSQQRAKMVEIRRRIARDLHDDVGSSLSSFRFFSELVKNKVSPGYPDMVPILERMSNNAAEISQNIRDIIWTIGDRQNQLTDLITRIREFGGRICEAKGIRFHAQFPEPAPFKKLRPDHLRNIYLIAKESIHNASKSEGCTEIAVRLRITNGRLSLSVYDNGSGFDPVKIRPGNGLLNIRQRAADIGGQIDIESCNHKGTMVSLTAEI